MQEITIEIKNNGRIDAAIAGLSVASFASGVSRSYAQKLVNDGLVRVNGEVIAKVSHAVMEGDCVCVMLPPPRDLELMPEDIPLDIVHEDEDLLVVNKPKGMVVHPAAGNENGTLVQAILHHCGGNLSGINGVLRPGIVHRIDKDTSGLLLVAKNDMAHVGLAKQIKEHSLERRYLALVNGKILAGGTVNAPIGRSAKDRKKQAVRNDGREAITHYSPIEVFKIKNRTVTLIECKLETGRTHQIRVHMAYIGHSVLGDKVYGSKNTVDVGNFGQMLHAYKIGFIHPRSGEYMEFEGEMPECMGRLLG